MKAHLSLIFLLGVSYAPAGDPLIVHMTPEGHAEIVFAHLAKIAAQDFSPPEFDRETAISISESKYPLPDFEVRGEFEAYDEFNERKGEWDKKVKLIENLRKKYLDNERINHSEEVTKLKGEVVRKRNSPIAKVLGIQQDKILLAYPTNPQPYDMDLAHFPAMPLPDKDIGLVSYGYAKFEHSFFGSKMVCDVETAKALRALADANSLLMVASLENAKVEIIESEIEVEVVKGYRPEIPTLALALLAEYLNPGSTVGAHIPKKEIKQVNTVKCYTVKLTCSASSYIGNIDARTGKWVTAPP